MEERRTQSSLLVDKNYQQEVEVEPQGNVGERSYSKAETERRDELIEDDKLLEQIFSKANMNLAYEQVKKNAATYSGESGPPIPVQSGPLVIVLITNLVKKPPIKSDFISLPCLKNQHS